MIGLRELAVVALVLLVLYGRTGVRAVRSPSFQRIRPWLSPVRRGPAGTREGARARSRTPSRLIRLPRLEGNRLFWVLTILAAAAIAAWIATRVIIASGVVGFSPPQTLPQGLSQGFPQGLPQGVALGCFVRPLRGVTEKF